MIALAPLLAASLALAGPAPAPEPAAAPATVLVMPFVVVPGAPDWAGMATTDTLLDAAVQQNHDSFLTLKQLDAVLRRRDLKLGDAAVALHTNALARALGATDVISGGVTQVGQRVVIDGKRVRLAGGAVLRSASVEGRLAQLPQLLQKLAGGLGLAHALGPPTTNLKALELGARCTFALARQSLAPRSRAVLPKSQLEAADTFCGGALAADPKLGEAHAGVAVLLAVRGKAAEARKEAAAANAGLRLVWWASLAECYAYRRAGDPAASRTVLEHAVAARPGFLHALGYLGEEQIEASDDAGALKTFDQYLARSPGHPWAIGKKGRALSMLGMQERAIAITKEALASSDDPELRIELASRYLDAGNDAAAEKLLLEVAALSPVRPLALLRLGYLYLRNGKLKEARAQFLRTVVEARREDEARTRALAYADLAQVAGREGMIENALEALFAARAEGLRKLPCDTPELQKWKGHAGFDAACSEDGTLPPGSAVDDEDDVVAVELQ